MGFIPYQRRNGRLSHRFRGSIGLVDGVQFTKQSSVSYLVSQEDVAGLETACTSGITSMYLLPWSASLNADIGTWDVSDVTDMSYMFSGAGSFDQNLDTGM